MQEFNISEKMLKRNRRLCFFVFLITIPGVFVITLLAGYANTRNLLIACGITAVVSGLILTIELPLLYRSMRKIKVLIDNDRIVRQHSRGEQSFYWSDITEVKMTKNPKDEYISIVLYSGHKRSITLGGFDEMNEIARIICQAVPGNTRVDTRRNKINYQGPVFCTLILIITFTVLFLVRVSGKFAEDIFDVVMAIAVALFLWIYKPLSKSNPSLKKLEGVLALVMLLLGAFMFVGMFMPD